MMYIRFYPVWVDANASAEFQNLYVDEFGSFTYEVGKAVNFGNIRMAALFENFRQPKNPSFYAGQRQFAIREALVGPTFTNDVTETARAAGYLKEIA